MNQDEAVKRPRAQKKVSILAAATEQFQLHGFEGTSMDRIATAANVSKRTVYNHFPSKDGLFQAIVGELLERLDDLQLEFQQDRPVSEQLQIIATRYLQLVAAPEFRQLSRVVLSRFIQHPEQANLTVNARHYTQAGIISWMEAAAHAGQLAVEDAEKATVQFTALINAFAFWPQLIGNVPSLDETEAAMVANDATDIFLKRYAKDARDCRTTLPVGPHLASPDGRPTGSTGHDVVNVT